MPERTLTVVVPAYREGPRLEPALSLLRNALDAVPAVADVIVVVDGPDVPTAAAARAAGWVTVITLDRTRGKGYAVREGLAWSTGDHVAYIDADMELHPEGIGTLLDLLKTNSAGAAIGSKWHSASQVRYPPVRRLQSLAFRTLTRTLFGLEVTDTQAGLKVFHGDTVRAIVPALDIDGFAFDLELLVALRQRGHKIVEGPVRVDHGNTSSTVAASALEVLADTVRIWRRARRTRHRVQASGRRW